MSSNYQQKKMMNALGAIDTKGNIVLEQFQDGTALLFQPGNAQPFCVATDYDRATASWSYGKYFSDLGCAHEAADPEIIEDASVRWVKEDIREKLKAQDIAPTEFNVQSVIMGDSRLWERPLDREFRDNMIASGNDDLDAPPCVLMLGKILPFDTGKGHLGRVPCFFFQIRKRLRISSSSRSPFHPRLP